MSSEVVLIDLSSIAHPIWHMSQNEPDPNHTSQRIVARVRALATDHPHVAVCCDSGRSFRHELAPTYKANRPEHEAPLHHQIKLACEQLDADGFPIWSVRGFEADDIIASATAKALETPDATVLVVTSDKDLLQLVSPRVRVMQARDGSVFDEAAVVAKFTVRPDQIRDFLTLVGDASDNIKGAHRIGPKTAGELLQKYGDLDTVYAALSNHPTAFKPAMATALKEFIGRLDETRALVTLRSDVPVPFETIALQRTPKAVEAMPAMEDDMDDEEPQVPLPPDVPAPPIQPVIPQASLPTAHVAANGAGNPSVPNGSEASGKSTTALTIREPEVLPAAPYERQLDPRSLREARIVATDLHASKLLSAYGTAQGVLSTIMLGRELGLPTMAALRGVHIIEGKHSLSAQMMVALVLKSGMAEYFEPVSFDATQATFVTKRKGGRNEVTLTHTIEMAKTAGLLKPNSNWEKIPTDMLVARAQSRLCRLVYPDVVGGLYTPDELKDASAAAKVA